MCGINGVFNRPASEGILNILEHRGPDQKGLYSDRRCSLATNRLVITDEQNGIQPLENDRYVMVFNGEIYNFKELNPGSDQREDNNSDSRTLLAHMTANGLDAVKDLRGMFAFAMYDKQEHSISLFRDSTGIKPLFYNVTQDEVCFGSEVKSILAQGVDFQIDEETLADFFIIGYPLGRSTIFKNIHQVEPGKYVTFSKEGKQTTRTYFSYEQETRKLTEVCTADGLADLITAAVREQVDPHRPILMMLSGGLDSGTLLHSIIENFGKSGVEIFTYSEAKDDEDYILSKKLAAHYGLSLNVVSPKKRFVDEFREYIYHLEDMSFDSFGIWCLCKEMAEHGKVGYCGQGADEMFAGYPKHRRPGAYFEKIKSNFEIYTRTFGKEFRNYDLIKEHLSRLEQEDRIQETTHFDVRQELPNIQLWQYDRVSMAHAFELRVPYLDERIVSFSAGLNSEQKISRDREKIMLRDAATRLGVPAMIRERPKYLGGKNISRSNVEDLKNAFMKSHKTGHRREEFFHKTSWMKGEEPIYCGMLDLLKELFGAYKPS